MMIDHLIYGVPDLTDAVDQLERRFGVRAAPGGKHLGVGTHNALLAVGPRTYLEVLAPDPDQPPPVNPRPFGLDTLKGAQLIGWAVGCDDMDEAIAGARAAGYDPGDAIDMTRTTPEGITLRWRLTLNAVAGGPVPFLIDWDGSDHPAASAPAGLCLDALVIEHPDPSGLEAVLRALSAATAVKPAGEPALVAHITGPHGTQELR